MVLTRKQLLAMDEAELREKVLIPLFRAMGFQDVFHHHGSNERGKDIVMWRPDQDGFRPRINFAVVVKEKKITGQARGNSSAAEVRFQIEECFTIPYANPVTSEKRTIDKVWVVTSKDITTDALTNLSGVFEQNRYHTDTNFIDGEKLWEWAKKYLSGQTALAKVQEVQQQLNDADSDWRPFVITKGGDIVVSVEPKHPNAPPLPISFCGEFPNTEEGQERLAAVERHIKTGASLTLESCYIKEFIPPPLMASFYDEKERGVEVLEITPSRSSRSWLAKVVMECQSGESVVVSYIDLQVAQGGTEEVTLDNSHQPVPWRFQITLNRREKRLNLQYGMDLEGRNIKWAVEALKFEQALMKGGSLRIYDLETGFEMFPQILVVQRPDNAAVEARLKFAEDLLFIQQQVRVPIPVYDRELIHEDVNTARNIVQRLKTGRITSLDDITLHMDKENTKMTMEAFKNDASMRFGPIEQTEKLFGVDIPLGPVTVTCLQTRIFEEDIPSLTAAIDAAKPDDLIPVRFRPTGNYPMEVTYHNWLPKAEELRE